MSYKFSQHQRSALETQARALRETGLSYKEIGAKLGISHSTVHRWLNKEAMAKHMEYNRKHALAFYRENKEEQKERSKQYYWSNRQAFHERYKRNYEKSKDDRRAYSRRYRQEHKKQIQEYIESNRWKFTGYVASRRARKLLATPRWLSSNQKEEIFSFYKESLRLTKETGIRHEVDHIHPLKHDLLCGLHVPWNLRVITKEENHKKSNKFMPNLGLTGAA